VRAVRRAGRLRTPRPSAEDRRQAHDHAIFKPKESECKIRTGNCAAGNVSNLGEKEGQKKRCSGIEDALHPRGGEASGEDRPGIKERANGAEAVIGVARRVERRLSAA